MDDTTALQFSRPQPIQDSLRLLPDDPRGAMRDAAIAVVAIAALILIAEGLLFRRQLPGWYLALYAAPDALTRLPEHLVGCAVEEGIYRLLLVTAIVAVGRRVCGSTPMWLVWGAILAAQALNVLPKTPAPESWPQLLWMALRFYLPGVVWGWLYWRHGFVTPLLAHPAAHLLSQALLLRALAG